MVWSDGECLKVIDTEGGALAFAMPGLVFALAILLVGGIASVFRKFAGRR
jgi:hypothetical protein